MNVDREERIMVLPSSPSGAGPAGRGARLGLGTALVTMAGACLPGAAGSPVRLTDPRVELADPAAVPLDDGLIRLYTTNGSVDGWKHVPTWTTHPVLGTPATPVTDALPTLPPWVRHNAADPFPDPIVWAPTVRSIAGRWLLMYAGGRATGAACLNAATATDPAGPFVPEKLDGTGAWCDPDSGSTGWLDPQLFSTAGAVYLYWSRQEAGGDSAIMAQALSPDGLHRRGSPVVLVRRPEVDAVAGPLGTRPWIENPAMTTDGTWFYLSASVGTWTGAGYRTVSLTCDAPLGPCRGPRSLTVAHRDPASLSYVRDHLPAVAVYGLRTPWVGGQRGVWAVLMTAADRPGPTT